jgi:hypothetical protein
MERPLLYAVTRFEPHNPEKHRAAVDLIRKIVNTGIKNGQYMDLLEYLMLFKSQKKLKIKGEIK